MNKRALHFSFFLMTALVVSNALGAIVIPFPSFNNFPNSSLNHADDKTNFFPWPFRATGWGLGGDRNVGLGDVMQPLLGNDNGMFYADLQGKYAYDSNWLMSAGGGFRQIYHDSRIFGAYVFADHSEFKNTNLTTSSFWAVSPGIESLGNVWDFRVNGYIPVSSQSVNAGTVFIDQAPTFFGHQHFIGHMQISQMLTTFNQVGPGIDGEIGYAIPVIKTARVYIGGYYFSPKDATNIRGISGRIEFPLNHYFALTAADTYDNNVNNSFEAGLRITIGGNTDDQTSRDISRRIVDPIPRNLATLSQGTGVPVVTKQTLASNGQFFLEKDNIYFFTTNDGMTFDPAQGTNNCTFEHPCSEPSFNQTTINDINSFTANANLFFSPGTYSSFAGPGIDNGQSLGAAAGISINSGQSLFGRTTNYEFPAQGILRALFLGNMNLTGNNQLDSIRLLDSVTDNTGAGSQVIALNIQNAPNVVLSNDDIQAVATETATLTGSNFASGIYANNSQVSIQNSTISAVASVAGDNFGFNFATSIGGNDVSGVTSPAPFNNNQFVLSNSSVSGTASEGGLNGGFNFAAGIGGNDFQGNASFSNNQFRLINSSVSSVAAVQNNAGGENLATGLGGNTVFGNVNFNNNQITLIGSTVSTLASSNTRNDGIDFAAGIGGNGIGDGVSAGNGNAEFNNNQISLTNSTVSAMVSLGTDNGANSSNFATGIGSNANSLGGNGNFVGNQITLTNSRISGAIASITGNNDGLNFAAGIGGNSFNPGGVADFDSNTITIRSSTINASAQTGSNSATGFNFATGIGGGNVNNGSTADFNNNAITLTGSTINVSALVGADNSGTNQAIGMNMNGTGNAVNIDSSVVNVLAQIGGTNTGSNSAAGLIAAAGNSFTVSNSTVNVTQIP